MKRLHIILAALLAVQIAVGVLVFWPRTGTGIEAEPLFSDVPIESIITLTIIDDIGNTLVLKNAAGSWMLPEADDYPALPDGINDLLEKVLGLDTGRLVTTTESSHKQLQVAADDYMRKIELETADGQTYTLYIGSSPTYGAAHFRLEGQDEAYLTSDISPWEVSAAPSSWINTNYLSRSADTLTEVTLEDSNGTFVFVKDDEGAWTLADLAADEELNPTAVNSFISQVTAITLQEPLGKTELPEYGLENPNAVVTLTGEGGSVTLSVGSLDPESGSYTVKSSDAEYYVTIASYYATTMVEGMRDGFLVLPPTPVPDGE